MFDPFTISLTLLWVTGVWAVQDALNGPALPHWGAKRKRTYADRHEKISGKGQKKGSTRGRSWRDGLSDIEAEEKLTQAIHWSYDFGVREASRMGDVPASTISEIRSPPAVFNNTVPAKYSHQMHPFFASKGRSRCSRSKRKNAS